MRGRAFLGIVLIVLGGLWLLTQTGYLNWLQVVDLLRFWPLLLIALGVSMLFPRGSWVFPAVLVVLVVGAGIYMVLNPVALSNETATATLQVGPGGAEGLAQLTTEINFTAGELRVSGGAEHAADLQARYHERMGKPDLTYEATGDHGSVRLDFPKRDVTGPSQWFNWSTGGGHDTLELAVNDRPVHNFEVNFTAGAGRFNLDGLAVNLLRLNMTAGDVQASLGMPPEAAVTSTDVRINMTAGKLDLELPNEAGVHLTINKTAGSTNASELGWRQEGNTYYSPNYDTATYRMDVSAEIVAGQLDVRTH